MWIEMPKGYRLYTEIAVSRPARALWIEIPKLSRSDIQDIVEAREGLVD